MSVSSIITRRWRSGRHVGAYKPTQTVRIQKGGIGKTFGPFTMLDGSKEDFGFISGGHHNDAPWHGTWVPSGDWITIPNVSTVDLTEEVGSDGVAEPEVATITIENVVLAQVTGDDGIFHQVKRGWMSPWRGFVMPKRAKNPEATHNEWFNVLNGSYRVVIEQGYGDERESVWMGVIDDTDLHSMPDQIVLTCRNMGVYLTDQEVFGWNKARDIRSPIVFADRFGATGVTQVGANADASTTSPNHSYQNVLRKGDSTYWLSSGHDSEDHTEWVEVHLPKGRYNQFYCAPEFDGMEMFISVYLRKKGLKKGQKCQIDGQDHADGWVTWNSLPDVPGDHGGFPYVMHHSRVSDGGMKRKLPFTMDCGDGTALRISFRRLGHNKRTGDYRAKVSRLAGYREKIDPAAVKSKHWILVDDAADVVKWVLMWAGFHEWEVQPFGVRLKGPVVFHQGDHLIDIIKHVTQQSANRIFFIDRPSSHPDSIGVPRFVESTATKPPPHSIQEVRDTNILTGVEAKFAKETLPVSIRVRGKARSAKKGGVTLGEDLAHRVQGVYFPPWSGVHRNVFDTGPKRQFFERRLAGVRKHIVHTDQAVETEDEALMYALVIAVQAALPAFTGTVEVPGYPGLRLNEQVSVVDTASGANTRLWIGSRHSTFVTGPNGSWTMTLAGAMVDHPDMLGLADDYAVLLKKVQSQNGELE